MRWKLKLNQEELKEKEDNSIFELYFIRLIYGSIPTDFKSRYNKMAIKIQNSILGSIEPLLFFNMCSITLNRLSMLLYNW